MFFPVAGIECNPLLPFGAAFVIAFFTSMAGVSGAFLLLPFQMGVLGYTTPSVSATNQLFNIIACPAGVWRFWREGRLLAPLTLLIALGTLPGVFIGAVARTTILRETGRFMIFVSMLLAYVGARLLLDKKGKTRNKSGGRCAITASSLKGFTFRYGDGEYKVKSPVIIVMSVVVGMIGGIYGIGGGAIISPFLVSFFKLPVHAIAGACLFSTFLTAILGVIYYCILSVFLTNVIIAPDWLLGIILGTGGMCGMYLGAFMQKHISEYMLRIFLGMILLAVATIFFTHSH